jgi:hypothetical protein
MQRSGVGVSDGGDCFRGQISQALVKEVTFDQDH